MNTLLHTDQENIKALLEQTQRVALNYFNDQSNLAPGRFIENISLQDLPDKGLGGQGTLDYFSKNFSDKITNSAGPRYFGFVTGGSTPAAVVGDWLVGAFDQNACGSNDSIAPQLERQALHFLKQLFGLDEEYFGSFVTGATASNFVSLAIARQWIGEQRGVDFSDEGILDAGAIHVLSGAPHSSVFKSLSMLGIGRKSLIKINTLPDREAIDIEVLENKLKEINEPVIVVANAGTVNTVDFDNLRAIGDLKKKYNFWLHVDAAFGGFAACSEKFSHFMNGINAADSITIDAHKWLNVPYDAAMQFTRHKNLQGKVFQNKAAYLGGDTLTDDFFHYTPENSRRFRALPSWFTLMAYGREGCTEVVERNCALTKLLETKLNASKYFKMLAPVRMNVACFTLSEENVSMEMIHAFLQLVRDDGRAFFTPTLYNGVAAIRAAVSNWQTQENDILIACETLEEVAEKFLHSNLRAAETLSHTKQ